MVNMVGGQCFIKYLFKYISKGTDRVVANITTPIGGTATTNITPNIHIDEIKNFVEARYIGPHEACWRILEFPIHYRDPAVQILAVHLENMQQIRFRSRERLQSIVDNPTKKKTTLTEWLDYNAHNTDGRHLTYLEFPSEYAWHATDKYWQRRRNLKKPSIGRLTYIHPSAGDLFYQRMLLCHQKGCKSFRDIRTVNNEVHPTNRAACEALGLLASDQEWVYALQEASIHATAAELRKLFVQILIFCDVSDPISLCETFWKHMSDDIPLRLSRTLQIPDIHKNETEMKAAVLFDIEAILNSYSKSLKDFGLPMPPKRLLDILRNRFLMEERNYNRELLEKEKETLIPSLNEDQKLILDEVLNAVTNNQQKLIFVYGHGGTGKTFLWKSITCVLRLEEKIVLTVASSGIASLLLPAGRTAHSRFKIPLNLTPGCTCNIKKNSQLADLLRQSDLIIWDEAPMNDRLCFEALDRCLRDILDNPDTFFGGKTIILGGDFRQTLPVKKKASKPEILDASITASYLWPGFRIHTLRQNIAIVTPRNNRLYKARKKQNHNLKTHIQEFARWLLDIGDGNIGDKDETDVENCSIVQMPENLCITDSAAAITELINFIYDDQTLKNPLAEDLQRKVIICPKNETADAINTDVLSLVTRASHVYPSSDEATPHGNDGGESELLYPNEYLNSLKFAGLPPHRLELKVGVPIILLRNLNLTGGLCNGTRLIVTQLLNRGTKARIITAQRLSGESVPSTDFTHK
ncbi:DNA helicase [Tanacetum coccineum]